MPAFITLTLNPALDLSTATERLQPTHKLRCGTALRFAGGGGINVARVLHRLGADVQAWGLAGGVAGAQVADLLAAEGVPTRFLPIAGDTRENFSVLETATGQEFRFVLPGPSVQPAEWQDCVAQLSQQTQGSPHGAAPRWLVASGSLPPGVPDDIYAQLARAVGGPGVRLAVDTSGAALSAALQAGVAVVKPSLRELRELVQQPLARAADWCAAAHSLVTSGAAEVVALSVGEDGAVLATRDGVWQAPAVPVPVATGTTGAGDCFLAALLWALDDGQPAPDALRWGVAAGAAALLSPGTALAHAADVKRIVASVPPPVAHALSA
ncbi:1-phosphofructokinase family hexose kinase [Acidovorax sp.]|uniref:1-phosphofructokinase family hexose kinase n=1 Tax=Acidovorax sp. TaxID=1872122 RepID=UPI0025C25D91|nr:1-phosphofructokinase family hexose kinase [Acidovorax sp.]MCI5069609.1 1-phosphofructokinase family hexose kinase [Acidovorax sp.]